MAETNNVFISWSGDYSKAAAKALKKWLRTTIQAAKPWMSEGDIQAGTQWLEEIDKALGLKFGIICLAPDNLTAPWIHFEAGALSKALQQRARVCPYLLGGLEEEQVDFPLARFQMAKADKDGTLSLIRSINAHVSAEPLADDELQTLFDERWPKLENELSAIAAPSGTPPPDPPVPQTVAKTYELLRTLAGPIQDIAAETEITRRGRIVTEKLHNAYNRFANLPSGGYAAIADMLKGNLSDLATLTERIRATQPGASLTPPAPDEPPTAPKKMHAPRHKRNTDSNSKR